MSIQIETETAKRMRVNALTDADLAAIVGCDRSMINKIRHGTAEPSLTLAIKLAKALHLQPQAFALPHKAGAE